MWKGREPLCPAFDVTMEGWRASRNAKPGWLAVIIQLVGNPETVQISRPSNQDLLKVCTPLNSVSFTGIVYPTLNNSQQAPAYTSRLSLHEISSLTFPTPGSPTKKKFQLSHSLYTHYSLYVPQTYPARYFILFDSYPFCRDLFIPVPKESMGGLWRKLSTPEIIYNIVCKCLGMPQLGVSPQTLKAETHLQPCARNDIFPAFLPLSPRAAPGLHVGKLLFSLLHKILIDIIKMAWGSERNRVYYALIGWCLWLICWDGPNKHTNDDWLLTDVCVDEVTEVQGSIRCGEMASSVICCTSMRTCVQSPERSSLKT